MTNFWLGYGEVKTGEWNGEKFEKNVAFKKSWKKGDYDYSTPPTPLDGYAGVLRDDIVLIDFDNMDDGEKVASILIKEGINAPRFRTDRGYHFLFQYDEAFQKKYGYDKEFTNKMNFLGFKVDVKWGKCLQILKFNGKERVFENEGSYELEHIKNYRWMLPLTSSQGQTTYKPMVGLKEGSRNETLNTNNWIVQSFEKKSGMTSKRYQKFIFEIANKHLFDTPMPKSEIDSVIRELKEGELGTPSDKKESKDEKFERIMDELIAGYNLRLVDGILYGYDEVNKWFILEGDEGFRWIMSKLREKGEFMLHNDLRHFHSTIKDACPIVEVSEGIYRGFKNGVLNLETGEFTEWSKDLFVSNAIPWNYNPNAPVSEVFEKFIGIFTQGDEEMRELLLEIIGYTFCPENFLRKAFIFEGGGFNGKSAFTHFIESLHGVDNCSNIAMNRLGEFGTYALLNSSVNISEEATGVTERNDLFKALVSGDYFTARQKSLPDIIFRPHCKLIVNTNGFMLKEMGKDAMKTRLIFVPFDHKLTKEEADPFIEKKLNCPEVMEYVICLGAEKAKKLLETKEFTVGRKQLEARNQFIEDSNSVVRFLKEFYALRGNDEFIDLLTANTMKEVRTTYENETGLKISPQTFRKNLYELFPTVRQKSQVKDRIIWGHQIWVKRLNAQKVVFINPADCPNGFEFDEEEAVFVSR